MESESQTQKGNVNTKNGGSSNPAYVAGHPFNEESKLKILTSHPLGYLLFFAVTTAVVLGAVYFI